MSVSFKELAVGLRYALTSEKYKGMEASLIRQVNYPFLNYSICLALLAVERATVEECMLG